MQAYPEYLEKVQKRLKRERVFRPIEKHAKLLLHSNVIIPKNILYCVAVKNW